MEASLKELHSVNLWNLLYILIITICVTQYMIDNTICYILYFIVIIVFSGNSGIWPDWYRDTWACHQVESRCMWKCQGPSCFPGGHQKRHSCKYCAINALHAFLVHVLCEAWKFSEEIVLLTLFLHFRIYLYMQYNMLLHIDIPI